MDNGCPLAKTTRSRRKTTAQILQGGRKVEEVADPLLDSTGAVSAVILSVSESPKTPAGAPDLIRLERLAAIAQATSGVVHDFNNIFARISGSVSLLREQSVTKTPAIDHDALMDAIETSVEQGKVLTGHLLEFGKGHEPDKSVLVLTDIIQAAVSFSLVGHASHPHIEIAKDLWPVHANAGQMTQLIGNLAINALQASKRGKPIWIQADNVTTDKAENEELGSGRYVRITIRDEGSGMPPEDLTHLFEPFFTTKPHGTGLGLATAHLIVKDHGGHIGVTSEVGRGTTFTVHLPAAEPGS